MKKYLLWVVVVSTLLNGIGVSKVSAHDFFDYDDTDDAWFAFGTRYALFSQTNNNGPINTFGNALDISAEVFLTQFLTFYAGYQFMSYNWEKKPSDIKLFDNKILLGARLYFGGLFFGGGGYSTWTTIKDSSSEIKENYWGGYIDVGYQYSIIDDLLTLETGGRLYFTPDSVFNKLTPYLTNNVSSSGRNFIHWDWYVGAKVLV